MNYHNITHDDMLNGEGLRVVLWVAGCTHYCDGCQNKITWDPNDGILFDGYAFDEIMSALNKPYISGITFSGGDPLHPRNVKTVTNLAKHIREHFPEKSQWLYTGYTYEQVRDLEVLQYIDVLVDGPFVKNLKDVSYHWAGSTNQRVIDIVRTRTDGKIVLWEPH